MQKLLMVSVETLENRCDLLHMQNEQLKKDKEEYQVKIDSFEFTCSGTPSNDTGIISYADLINKVRNSDRKPMK